MESHASSQLNTSLMPGFSAGPSSASSSASSKSDTLTPIAFPRSTGSGAPSTTPATGNVQQTVTGDPATQNRSQRVGAHFNPFPLPYAYNQLPSNGANIYAGMMGGYPGMMGGYPGMMGGFRGLSNGGATIAGNLYGGYEYQNDNPNSPMPSYGYSGALGPTHYQTPLSGDGTAPNQASHTIYAKQFVDRNDSWVFGGIALASSYISGSAFNQILNIFTGARSFGRGSALRFLATVGVSALVGVASAFKFAPSVRKALEGWYTGADYNDNGHVDGSYTTQRNYKVDLPKLL
jgi:hypothetical protein